MKLFSAKQGGFKLSAVVLFFLSVLPVFAAGEVDPTFNAAALGINNGTVSVIEKQSDGKFLVGGTFTDVNGHPSMAIVRLNTDGTVDTSFSSPDFGNGTGYGGAILAIGVQSDGKIVVGGDIYGVNGIFNKKIYRLNPNGSLDNTFQSPSFGSGGIVYDLEIQPDDKIVAGGDFSITTNGGANKFMRLNADGTLDPTFANFTTVGTVYGIEVQSDGKILTAGSALVRRHTDGSSDLTFNGVAINGSGVMLSMQLAPDGKVFVGGQFNNLNGFSINNLAKVNADGSLDLTFNQNGTGPNSWVDDILLAADGKIVISGFFSSYNGTTRQKIARLNADGSLDTSFLNNPSLSTLNGKDAEFFADGKILLGGGVQFGATSPQLVRLNSDGTTDNSISYTVALTGSVREVVVQTDGKILIAGQFTAVNGVKRNSLARLNPDGSVDTTFVPYFNNGDQEQFNALALQPDGKILVGGPLRRLNADGTQDSTFNAALGSSAFLEDIRVLANGQILVGGNLETTVGAPRKIVRLNSNGLLDGLFALDQPNSTVYDIEIQPDGKILIGGSFQQVGSTLRGRVARLTAEGALDLTFNPPGGANADVYNVALQADGKVVVVGNFTGLNGSGNQVRIGRLNADGSLDTSFAQFADASVVGLKIQPDGKILLGGVFSSVAGAGRIGIARLNANGTLDNSFNASAPNGVIDIELQADGKILLGGAFLKINGVPRLRVARLLNTTAPARTLFDYDGDGKADVSVFRPSENKWYILQSSNNAIVQTVFAIVGDVPAPADFDGDGKTDLAIFRPSTGDWWYLSSINGSQINVHWGQVGDIPRPSDFDGDGKTDFVVYRPSNSVWYRFGSTGQTSILAFGIAEDKPLIGDFDGDGKSDPAVFRPSTGDWWYASSLQAGQFRTVHWGANGDIPVPGDYDADGKTDFVVFRPSDGGWYILYSTGSYTIATFGTGGDKPVAADYDGDGRTDIAVFRPSTGTWYLLQTTAGFGAVQWGAGGDIPTENAFLP